VIRCLAIDYGGTLTSPEHPVVPHLGMRRVDPAVITPLHQLRRAGLKLLLASNTRLSRRLALRQAGIEDLFDQLLMSHELGCAKPDPAFYQTVLHAAACPPNQVLCVGNHPVHDVLGPQQHGMRAVLVRPPSNASAAGPVHRTVPTITHLSQLPELVMQLCHEH
jgi:FMN phosphatase YigB (HAD superfamily)